MGDSTGFIRWILLPCLGLLLVGLLPGIPAPWVLAEKGPETPIAAAVNGTEIWLNCLELEDLSSKFLGYRYTGGPGASAVADWIREKLEAMGLDVVEETFDFPTWILESSPSMEIILGNGSSIRVESFVCEYWSIGTAPGETEAELVVLPCPNLSGPEDLQEAEINLTEWDRNTTGRIVLTGMSSLMNGKWSDVLVEKFSDQKPLVAVYAWWYDFFSTFQPEFQAFVGNRSWGLAGAFGGLPVGYVSHEDSLWLRDLDGAKARVRLHTHIEEVTHRNVLGTLRSPASDGSRVIVCAHYDSAMTPGFVDDGTGISSMLEIAQTLSRAVREGYWSPASDLVFAAFDAEELGLVGSLNYVYQHREELGDILAVISLDSLGARKMVATPGTLPGNMSGVSDLYTLLAEQAFERGVSIEPVYHNGDHTAFSQPSSILDWSVGLSQSIRTEMSALDPGIDSIGVGSSPVFQREIWTEGIPGWIHTYKDTSQTALEQNWVNPQRLQLQTEIVAHAILRISEMGILAALPSTILGLLACFVSFVCLVPFVCLVHSIMLVA